MKRFFSLHPALRAIAATGVMAFLAPAVQALPPGGSVSVGSWTGGPDTGTALTTCVPTQIGGGGFQLLGQDCTVPGGGSATARNQASFQAPSAFDPSNPNGYQLAGLGARSTLEIEVHSYAGTNHLPNDPRFALHAQATASFRDYLMLGALRPSSLVLAFHLSGEFRIAPALGGSPDPLQTFTVYGVGVGSGHLGPDGVFGATDPYAYGLVQVSRDLRIFGGMPVVTPWVDSHPGGAITHSESPSPLGGTDVRVTLGSDFFSNPANDAVLLDLSLASVAYGPAWTFGQHLAYGTVLTGNEISADFGSTFVMVGLQAFDESGQDITASAGLGFQSLQAVPEPQAWLLFAAGLIGVALRRRGLSQG